MFPVHRQSCGVSVITVNSLWLPVFNVIRMRQRLSYNHAKDLETAPVPRPSQGGQAAHKHVLRILVPDILTDAFPLSRSLSSGHGLAAGHGSLAARQRRKCPNRERMGETDSTHGARAQGSAQGQFWGLFSAFEIKKGQEAGYMESEARPG